MRPSPGDADTTTSRDDPSCYWFAAASCVAAVASARGQAEGPLTPAVFHARSSALGGPVSDALRRQADWLLSREAISLTPTRPATNTTWNGKCGVPRSELLDAVEQAGAQARDGWGVTVASTAVRPAMSPPLDGMPTGPEYCASLVQVWHGRAARHAAVALAGQVRASLGPS